MTDEGSGDAPQERTYRVSLMFLDDVYGLMKVDAATHRVPLTAISVALSRLYLDPELRARVLREAVGSAEDQSP